MVTYQEKDKIAYQLQVGGGFNTSTIIQHRRLICSLLAWLRVQYVLKGVVSLTQKAFIVVVAVVLFM